MSPMEQVARLGGLASRKQLALLGQRRYAIDRALRDGTLVRVRPGWVGTSDANQLSVLAVLNGARLTGSTALRSYGIWNGFDLRTHLQLRPNTCPVQQRPLTPISRFTPPKFVSPGIVRHWAPHTETPPGLPAWRVTVADAILRFARTESDEQVIAAVESAVKQGRLSRSEVPGLIQRMPRRLRRLSVRLTFLAGSGLETVARLRLEDVGLAVQQQVEIGPDTVDIVIDGWLVIELDGDEWHDPVKDRIRTNRLIRAGYRVLRFGHREVFADWGKTFATIVEMLRTPSGVAS
jgi:very-short-patch-repair endonuclease